MLIQQKQISDLMYCSYQQWYDKYSKHCTRSYCLQIPKDVQNYLKADFFILPKECKLNNISSSSETKVVGEISNFEESEVEEEAPEFTEFSNKLLDTIRNLGGSAFIKTNWHSPKDSIWITAGQTLRVKDLSDIYQLLKASSICKEDLALISDDDFSHIILKKWKDIHPGTEFRCFVKNRNLIAISPRDWPEYHEHINTQKHEIIKDIVSLFKEKIKDTFSIDNYCFDVIREEKDKVQLMDFSPFYEKYTNSLAFDWKYLNSDEILATNYENDESDNPEFRFLANNVGIQPNPRNNYGFPQEMIEMFKSSRSSEEHLEHLSQLTVDQIEEHRSLDEE